mmetsp:Transcript_1759/g.4799  ORF Transcript_1759/g.4799 Transcript_1759/m.4799 type:complete len:130 (-) Transcript_1759:160-549(-)|eukprot:CAMPEP_0194546170 /NCGR_PEP_ID=MMETSP0253-20130528/90266_1 /TAXON_ID=2966 /ORGANISM="Noctiluca scintillans" /LENGTH=129 /DNA_ID=CAMNT_0039393235 /DNA_START=58 /DNA_END=447 /DNA_ORIENTATION=-
MSVLTTIQGVGTPLSAALGFCGEVVYNIGYEVGTAVPENIGDLFVSGVDTVDDCLKYYVGENERSLSVAPRTISCVDTRFDQDPFLTARGVDVWFSPENMKFHRLCLKCEDGGDELVNSPSHLPAALAQ